LIAKLRGRYEVIIIDSPPIGIVSDALALLPLVDRTVMVAKNGSSSVPDLKQGARMLKDRGAAFVGLVLTSTDPEDLSSIDRKTLYRYAMGISAPASLDRRNRAVDEKALHLPWFTPPICSPTTFPTVPAGSATTIYAGSRSAAIPSTWQLRGQRCRVGCRRACISIAFLMTRARVSWTVSAT